jgi:hypothetical protein
VASSNRWYPTQNQLSAPDQLERTFRQLLQMHYEMQDRLEAMQRSQSTNTLQQGGGPIDTTIVGLPVQPIDSQTLADGAKLQWSKKDGMFKFV